MVVILKNVQFWRENSNDKNFLVSNRIHGHWPKSLNFFRPLEIYYFLISYLVLTNVQFWRENSNHKIPRFNVFPVISKDCRDFQGFSGIFRGFSENFREF